MDVGFNHFLKMRIKQLFIEHSLALSLISTWFINFYFIKWFVAIMGIVVCVIIYFDNFKFKIQPTIKSEYLLLPFSKVELIKYVVLEKIFLTFIFGAVFSIFMFSVLSIKKAVEVPNLLVVNFMFLFLTVSIGLSIIQTFSFLKHTYAKKKNIQRFCEVLRMSVLILILLCAVIGIIALGVHTNFYFSFLALLVLVAFISFIFVKNFDLFVLREISYFKKLSFNYLIDLPASIIFMSIFLFYLTNEDPKKIEAIKTIKTTKSY